MKPANLTDEKLYELCRRYGSSALLWRQKFIGLLPEVNRRRLYERKGFSDVYEFAFKLCGLSEEQVRLTLNLKSRFGNMPTLEKMLEEGEVSINKLARIVSIATPENEKELAEKVKILPVKALNTLVRDEKMAAKNTETVPTETRNQNGFQKPLFGDKSLYVQTDLHVQTFELAPDITEQLNELHSKGIDVNELLRKALNQRKEEIEKRKEEIAREIQDERKERNDGRGERDVQVPTNTNEPKSKSASRYVPVKVKEVIKEEHGTKCSIPTCQKPAEVLHHTQTFGLSHSHDPRFLAPLCHEHHLIAHSMDVKYHEMRHLAA